MYSSTDIQRIKERHIVTDLAGAFHKNPRTITSESPTASAVG